MAEMIDTIAFIFARGGSKGLPGKNIKDFAGKPLIAWAIEHAKAVNRIRRVIVSTDSDEIASISKEYGAEVMHNLDPIAALAAMRGHLATPRSIELYARVESRPPCDF